MASGLAKMKTAAKPRVLGMTSLNIFGRRFSQMNHRFIQDGLLDGRNRIGVHIFQPEAAHNLGTGFLASEGQLSIEGAVAFPNSPKSALACCENFLILSAPVFLTNREFELCASASLLCLSTAFMLKQ